MNILLLEDDPAIADTVAFALRREGFTVEHRAWLAEARERLRTPPAPALLILDIGLPDGHGLDLCRELRAGPLKALPVIVLSARSEEMDRVLGLELGADDYLPKPFEPRELAARLQTILRRTRLTPVAAPAVAVTATWLRFEGLEIDTARREVKSERGLLELTGTEYELLVLLAREPGRVFSRDDILNRLRGQEAELFTRAVDILVSRLRRKLEPLAALKTLRNAGYCFALPEKS